MIFIVSGVNETVFCTLINHSEEVLLYVRTAQEIKKRPNDYIIRLTDKGGRAGDGPVRGRFAQRIGVLRWRFTLYTGF